MFRLSRAVSRGTSVRSFASSQAEKKELILKMKVWGSRLLLFNEIMVMGVLLGGGAWLLSYAINWDSVKQAKERMSAKMSRKESAT